MQIDVVRQAVSSKDQQVVLAASASPMLLNIPYEDQEGEFRLVITYLLALLSIKEVNEPSDEQINVMLDFLRKHYRTITMAEIKLAADLNMVKPEAGKDDKGFDEKGPEFKVKHYQCLDMDYLSTIIINYQQDKQKAFMALRNATPSTRLKEIAAPMPSLDLLLKYYQEKKELPKTYNWLKVFDDMREQKKCESFEVMKQWMVPEKEKLIAELHGKIKHALNLVEKRKLEVDLMEENLNRELRIRYVKKRIPELCIISIS